MRDGGHEYKLRVWLRKLCSGLGILTDLFSDDSMFLYQDQHTPRSNFILYLEITQPRPRRIQTIPSLPVEPGNAGAHENRTSLSPGRIPAELCNHHGLRPAWRAREPSVTASLCNTPLHARGSIPSHLTAASNRGNWQLARRNPRCHPASPGCDHLSMGAACPRRVQIHGLGSQDKRPP